MPGKAVNGTVELKLLVFTTDMNSRACYKTHQVFKGTDLINFDGCLICIYPRVCSLRLKNAEIYIYYNHEEISLSKCHFSHFGSCIPFLHILENQRKYFLT